MMQKVIGILARVKNYFYSAMDLGASNLYAQSKDLCGMVIHLKNCITTVGECRAGNHSA